MGGLRGLAFHAFDPALNAAMSEEEFDAHLKDTRIVRNGQKVASVRANGQFMVDLAREHGSAAKFFADWPDSDFVGLLELMKSRAARCAGETAMRFFRTMGKPAFITTRDVSAALIEAGVVTQAPKSEGTSSPSRAPNCQPGWSQAAGLNLTELSRVLALSAGPIYDPNQTWRQRGGD